MTPRVNKELGPVEVLPVTEDLALRAARVDRSLPRADQVAQIEAAELSPEALRALVRAGWRELAPRREASRADASPFLP